MTSLLCYAFLYTTLGFPSVGLPVVATKTVTITATRKCAALGEAEKQNPGWEAARVRPAEPGKTMNNAWVVTLERDGKAVLVRSTNECSAIRAAVRANPMWVAVEARAMTSSEADDRVWLVTLTRY